MPGTCGVVFWLILLLIPDAPQNNVVPSLPVPPDLHSEALYSRKLLFCLSACLPSVWVVIWALPHPPPPPLSSAGQAALSSVGDLPVLLSAPSPCSCVCVCDHLAVFQKGKNPSPSMLALLALPNTQQECCGYAWSPSVKPDSPRTGSQLTEWLLPTQHTVVEEEKSCFTTRLWRKSGKVLG